MPGENKETIKQLQLRARLPKIFGVAAIALLVVTAGTIIYSLFWTGNNPEFRMKGFPASLSKDVVATINGYERREMDGELTKYYIRADKATSFADNHQELENVYLEVYSEDGSATDKISAQKAVYIPAENKNFTAYFAGSVNVETRDRLHVKTEQLTYTKETEIAAAEELVEFERLNIHGKSIGANARIREKILELQKDVEIHASNEDGTDKGTLIAGSATYDQNAEKIELRNNVSVSLASSSENGQKTRTTDLSAARAIVYLDGQGGNSPEDINVQKAELFEGVRIISRQGDEAPTNITSNYALYEKAADKFELKDAVHIVTAQGEKPTEIRADYAVYEQPQGRINLTGNSSITQGTSLVQGRSIYAELNAAKKVKLSEVSHNAFVKQTLPERTTEVTGSKIKAIFNDNQSLAFANVIGSGTAVLVPANASEYTRFTMTADRVINVEFKGEGLLNKMQTEGRTNIRMDVPNKASDSANKTLAADSVTTNFNDSGKDMTHATAFGNAELVVTPLNASESNYKTTVNAPRFDCDFFTTGNDPKTCVAATKTKTTRVPTQPSPERGTQNITSDKLFANFSQQTKELESLEAVGDAKFVERDRNATSERIVYTAGDEVVRLRGGSPVVWDSKARAKAPEIDWDTRNEMSELRGGVSTTYYSPKSTGGTAPFGKSEKPVYVTAQMSKINHRTEQAVFTGNARGWQDNNYVRGERLTFSERDGVFVAEENVQSLLYEAKRRENGVETNQPIFVAAQKLTYTRDNRLLRYENNVDIRQGKDRITGGVANIFLTENSEPARTEIEQNVVIVQPNRRAVADYARYDNSGETIYLRGNPATVDDAEQGRSQASEFTVNLKENRWAGVGPSKQNSGRRTRSVYKIKDQ